MTAHGKPGRIRIGISGWTYAPWRGGFYPENLPHAQELAHAAAIFPTIEINGTFYGLQKPPVFTRWAAETGEDFVFAVKGSRFITHLKRLREPAVPLANFFGSGLLRLGRKLGPILWQFPPNFRFDAELMEAFLAVLPRDTAAMAALAHRHDKRLKARAALATDAVRPVRHAVEIRHDSFRDPAFTTLLRRFGVALVCADAESWPRLMDLTADFVYCRLHGAGELYRSGYAAAALRRWADRVTAWSSGAAMTDGEFVDAPPSGDSRPRDVFLYFDNTDKRRAPDDAQSLMRLISRDA